jgi:hypothetical protein
MTINQRFTFIIFQLGMYLVVKILSGRGHTLRAAPIGEFPPPSPAFTFLLLYKMIICV